MGPQDYEDSSLEDQVVEAPDSSYSATISPSGEDRQTAHVAGAKSWQREHSPFRFNKQAFLITAGAVAGIALVVALSTWAFGRQNTTTNNQSNFANQKVDTQTIQGYERLLDGTASLQVNGQLQVTNGVTLEPSGAPTDPEEGQLYYDSETNQPYYYDGSKFVSFAPTNIPNHVSSLDGITGSVTLGNGLQITSGGELSLSTAVLQSLGNSDGTVNWTDITGYPAACASGQAITRLDDNPVCSSFLTASVANTSYLRLQSVSPGTIQTGNFNISGTGIAGGLRAGTINATNTFQSNGIPGVDVTCVGGDVLQNQEVSGGIVTGGSCVPVATGGIDSLNGLTGSLTVQGTAGEIDVSDNGTDTITFALDPNVSLLGQGIDSAEITNGTIVNADLQAGSFTNITGVGVITIGTWNGTSIADAYIQDAITISSAGAVDWTALNNYPAACAADEAITALGDTVTCEAFLTGSAADGAYVQLQGTTPGAAQTGNLNITGTAIVGGLVLNDGNGQTTTLQAGDSAGDLTFILPTVSGSQYQCLKYDIGGQLIWDNCDGGSGGGSGVTSLNSLSGAVTIQGNAQIGVATSSPNINLSINADSIGDTQLAFNTGQHLTTTSTPTFAGLIITGDTTANRPGSPTEGQLYYDTDTDRLLVYSNGKWQADRSSVTKTVAPSNAAQNIKDSADYVADGTGDQIEINAALTAAAGGKVYLFEGTFTASATIVVPNNTTLTGAGKGTVIELADIDLTDNLIENSDTTTGTGVVIRDIKLDGRKDLNGAGTQYGIRMSGMGDAATGVVGTTIENTTVQNFRNTGIHLNSTDNSTIRANSLRANDEDGIGFVNSSTGNTVTENKIYGSVEDGINIFNTSDVIVSQNIIQNSGEDGIVVNTSSRVTVTGNTVEGSADSGIKLNSATDSTVSSNVVGGNSLMGIYIWISSNNNLVTGNRLYDNGGATDNNAVVVTSSDSNTITGNAITDTDGHSSTNYSINITNAASDTNYLAGNTLGGGSINNVGTGTVRGGQVNSSGNFVVQPAGTIELSANTNVTGSLNITSNLDADGSLTVGNANQFVISNTGVVTSGTWNGTAISDTYVEDSITVSSSGTVDWQALSNYPAACAAGEAITALADSPTCSSFLTGSAADGSYVQLQGTSPGSAQTGNLNISGTAIVGALVLNDGSGQTTTLQAGDSVGDLTFILPTAAGSQYQCLKYDTAGQLIWDDCDGGSGGGAGVTTLNSLSGSLTIQGNAQVGVSASNPNINLSINADSIGDAQLTFNTGQHLTVTSTPTFAGLIITGNTTANRPVSPTEGQFYYDTDTDRLLVYSNGKWQADRSDAILVAASNSSQADKDAADYVADGNTGAAADGDQVQINAALTAGSGKKVVLLAGTYSSDATILVPNNTTLAGVGTGTIIELADIDLAENLIENSDNSTGTGVVIRDMKLDGRKDLNSSGVQRGIHFTGMGGGTGSTARQGARITGIFATSFRNENVLLTSSSHNVISDSTFQASSSEGMQFTNSTYNVVTGSKFVGNGTSGFNANSTSSNNTLTGNYAQGNTSAGFSLASGSFSTLNGNTSQGNGYGFFITTSSNTITGNTAQGNTSAGLYVSGANNTLTGNTANGGLYGINIGGDSNDVTGNTSQGSLYGMMVNGDHITVSGNYVVGGSAAGINLNAANFTVISGNRIYDSGGASANNGISLTNSDSSTIADNVISDTSATTTNYAITLNNTSDTNHLSGNNLGTGSINDLGSNNVYGGQVDASGNYVIQPAGTVELMKNTNVTGNLDASGSLTVGSADQFVISSLGVVTSGTWQGNAIADAYVADNLTVSSSGTVDWAALSNYPAACSAGEAITGLADSPTCSAFLTGSAADGAYVQLQGTTPGSAQTGNLNISGTAIVGAVVLNDGNGQTTTIQAGDSVGDLTFILPTAAGSQFQCLKYDTGGQLIWDNCDGGSGGGSGVTSLNGLSGGLTIQGNTQVAVNASNPNINLSINDDTIGDDQLTFDTGQNLTVISAPTFAGLIITGNDTANRPLSPAEGQFYYDTDTDRLLVYSNGKWQADRSDAILVAASNSSQADKDAADYVADGNTGAAADGDQVEINNALTAGNGKKVVLLAGTYVIDAAISVPDNTTFTGIGNGTVIELADIDSIVNMIVNSGNPGTGIVIQNMKLDGRSDLNASATQHGIHLTNVGSVSSSLTGAIVQNVTVTRVLDAGIYLDTGSENNKVINNTVRDTASGIYLYDSASNNYISGNSISNTGSVGISAGFNSNNNIITDNIIINSGGATDNNGITIAESDSNRITSNTITDSSATTTNYSVYLLDADANSNYLAGNNLGGGSVNDSGTGTIYGGQVDASGNYVVQPAGTVELMKNTNVTGTLNISSNVDTNGSLTVGSADQFVVNSSGVVTSGTWQGNVIGLAYGGTNNNSYTTNGVVYSNGTSLVSTAAGTTGQCLLATTGSAPSWGACTASTLQGTYNASSPATILLSNAKDFTINTNDTATDSSIVFNLSCATCSASGGRFAVQDAGTDIFTVNPNGDIIIGSASNGVTFLASNGYKLEATGNARNSKAIRLLAEYPSVVLTADLTSNLGVMTSDYDSVNRMNYYNWTTTELSNQDYDIVVQVPLPSDFGGWDGSNPLSITGYTTDTTNGTIKVTAIDSAGATICNEAAVTLGSTGTWVTNNSACTLSTGTYTAGNYITLRFKLQAPTSGDTRIGNIVLNYKSKF